jgi:hypothetical protein
LPLGGNHAPFPFLATDFQESEAAFSPDGRWVAYTSNESGRSQVYVREFQDSPGSARAGGKWMVSKEDGRLPEWKADGADLMYLSIRSPARAPSSPAAVLSVAVEKARTFQAGATRELFQAPMIAYIAAAPDFQRFLARVPVEDKTSQAFTVVLNWTSLLKAR